MATRDQDEALAALIEASDRTQPLAHAIRQRLEYPLPDEVADRFVWIGRQMNLDAPSAALERLTVRGGSRRDWLIPLRAAVLDHVREGLGASSYHLDNVRALEEAVIGICLANLPPGDPPPNGLTISPGGVGRLNYEYQAFRFALKRTLDYLAVAVAAGFRCKRTRFSQLERTIRNQKPEDVRERVTAALAHARDSLTDLLNDPSARDRIAHWEAAPAGAINVMWHGNVIELGLLGGGEELVPWPNDARRTVRTDQQGRTIFAYSHLGALLEDQLVRTETAVFAVLEALGISTRAP